MSFKKLPMGVYSLDNSFCGDVRLMQTRLQKIGLYSGPIDGMVFGGTFKAIQAFASQQGLPVPATPTSNVMTPMSEDFCSALENAAEPPPPTTLPTTSGTRSPLAARTSMRMLSPIIAARFQPMTILGARAAAAQAPPEQDVAYVDTGFAPVAEPTPWTTYALIGGGVLLAGGLAYFAFGRN